MKIDTVKNSFEYTLKLHKKRAKLKIDEYSLKELGMPDYLIEDEGKKVRLKMRSVIAKIHSNWITYNAYLRIKRELTEEEESDINSIINRECIDSAFVIDAIRRKPKALEILYQNHSIDAVLGYDKSYKERFIKTWVGHDDNFKSLGKIKLKKLRFQMLSFRLHNYICTKESLKEHELDVEIEPALPKDIEEEFKKN